jgi:hypothetical protein
MPLLSPPSPRWGRGPGRGGEGERGRGGEEERRRGWRYNYYIMSINPKADRDGYH